MFNKIKKFPIIIYLIICFILILSFYVFAWTNPSQNPPLGGGMIQTDASGNFKVINFIDFSNSSTKIGYQAGINDTGLYNIWIGYQAGTTTNNSSDNIGIGRQALNSNETGNRNIAIGYWALRYNRIGHNNIAIGYRAIYGGPSTTTGSYNIGIGPDALSQNNNGGDGNIAIGYAAGNNITTGSNNIIIGYNVYAPSSTANYQLNIGNLIFGTGLDATGTNISSGNIGIGTPAPQYKLEVQGSAAIGNFNTSVQDFRLQRKATHKVVRHWYTSANDSPWYTYGENLIWSGERAGNVLDTTAANPYYEAYSPLLGYKEFGFVNATSGSFTSSNLIPNLVLKNNGNVGIGTTTPAYKLEVNGVIRSSGNQIVYQCPAYTSGCPEHTCNGQLTINSTCIKQDWVCSGTCWCGSTSTISCTPSGRILAL